MPRLPTLAVAKNIALGVASAAKLNQMKPLYLNSAWNIPSARPEARESLAVTASGNDQNDSCGALR